VCQLTGFHQECSELRSSHQDKTISTLEGEGERVHCVQGERIVQAAEVNEEG
jgi:hypothetical protein